MPRYHGTSEQRFWRKVNKAGPLILDTRCWQWIGVKSEWGHGRIRKGGKGGGRMIYAHRVSWEMHGGTIPSGNILCHKCHNAACVNPSHLYIGTESTNRVDDIVRGGHHLCKLNVASIPTIRKRVHARTGKKSEIYRVLAAEYGVLPATIRNVITGKTWSHVT